MSSPSEEHEETESEVPWTDDSIRWTEEENARDRILEGDEEDEDYGEMNRSIFQDPDPTTLFRYQFGVPPSTLANQEGSESGTPTEHDKLEIELYGYKEESDEIWRSTGLTIWKASKYLCDFILQERHQLHNKQILELGAGLGLCGILAYKLSTNCSICITDGDTDALDYLRRNIQHNKVSTVPEKSDRPSSFMSCHQLLWGQQSSQQFLSRYGAKDVETKDTEAPKKYDIIIASDIIYSPVIVQPLWETIQTLLEMPSSDPSDETSAGGQFWLAFAKRKVPVSVDDVLSSAKEAGFKYREVEVNQEGLFLFVFQWE